MTNTMSDLRRECAKRLRKSLHGREIDTLKNNVETPHMLGVVPIGAISTPEAERETLLDPAHSFWQDFEEDVRTEGKASRKVESAIRSLKQDGVFRMTHPYGEEADIVYCEVDTMEQSNDVLLPTECAKCGEVIDVPLSLNLRDGFGSEGTYNLTASVECPHCEFSRTLETNLQRQ